MLQRDYSFKRHNSSFQTIMLMIKIAFKKKILNVDEFSKIQQSHLVECIYKPRWMSQKLKIYIYNFVNFYPGGSIPPCRVCTLTMNSLLKKNRREGAKTPGELFCIAGPFFFRNIRVLNIS